MLLPLLRTRTQAEALAWIILQPGQQFSIVEIAEAVGTSEPTASREASRLVDGALHSAEESLHREVNVRRAGRAAWDADDCSLKRTVMPRRAST